MEANLKYTVHEMNVSLEDYQLHKLNEMLVFAMQYNSFYKKKFADVTLPIRTKKDLAALPFTTKKELVEDQQNNGPYGTNHSYPESSYIRYSQTSGTSGRPLKILDTEKSWNWLRDCWVEVLEKLEITNQDRLFLAFSFGPFIGFWLAYEAAKKAGTLVITGGGLSSKERLNSIIQNQATVLVCTPSYALHLAEVAHQNHIDIKNSSVQKIITAGEPGGSIPSVRNQMENLWNAKVYDQVGMTEVGAYGYSCNEQNGMHVIEEEFIVEIINPKTLEPVEEGETGELVLSNFNRYGYPLVRYRTGDMVKCSNKPCPCGNPYTFLPGGIIGRADDMVVIRGVNIFPQSIEGIAREFDEIIEFRIIYYTEGEMNQVKVEVEAKSNIFEEFANRLRERIGLRIDVEEVPPETLPRFELKSRRVLDQRK